MTIDEIDFKIKSLLKERTKLSHNTLKNKIKLLKNVFGEDLESMDGDKTRLKYFIIQKLYNQGYNMSYIAKELNISTSTVVRGLNKYVNLEKLKKELFSEIETVQKLIKDY